MAFPTPAMELIFAMADKQQELAQVILKDPAVASLRRS